MDYTLSLSDWIVKYTSSDGTKHMRTGIKRSPLLPILITPVLECNGIIKSKRKWGGGSILAKNVK